MATRKRIMQELEFLNDDEKIEVLNFIISLKKKILDGGKTLDNTKPQFGWGKAKIEMADDFDAPLEDFKDYM